MKRYLLIIAFTVVAFSGYYIYSLPKIVDATKDNPNIVIISVDTLRADHLGVYGYSRKTSPNIDKFAEKSIVFDNFFTPVSCTLPSYASLFTGQYPLKHEVFEEKLSDKTPTIATLLKDNDYNTAAFVSSALLSNSYSGFAKGFKHYNETSKDDNAYEPGIDENTNTVQNAEKTYSEVSDWLDKNKRGKFFLFTHFFDPHTPYKSPAPFDGRFSANLPENKLENPEIQTLAFKSKNVSKQDVEYINQR